MVADSIPDSVIAIFPAPFQEYFLGCKDLGHAVAQLVEALRCKSEGRGFDSR